MNKRIPHLRSAVLLVAGLAIGCEVGPNYQPPKANMAPTFGEADDLGAIVPTTHPASQVTRLTSRPISITQWWATFHDPELESLIQRAMQNNLDLQQAASRIREARYQTGVVGAKLYPNVDATAGYQHARGSKNINVPLGGAGSGGGSSGGNSPGGASSGGVARGSAGSAKLAADALSIGGNGASSGGGSSGASVGGKSPLGGPQSPLGLGGLPGVDTDLYQVGFDASWEADVFGGTRRAIEAANADTAAAIEDRRAVLISMLAEIARTYIELRGEQQQALIARDNLATQQKTLEILQDQSRAGLATHLDVSRQAALLATTAAELPAIESQVRRSVHALGVLVSDSPDALSKELIANAPLPPTPPEVPVGVPSELLRRRPDIRRAERQLAAASARVGVATADLYPKFSITGQTGFDASQPKNLLRWDSRYLLISPGINWPIFDAGRIRSNIAVQNESATQAYVSYQQSILNALQETEDAMSNYRQEQLRRKALADAVAASRDAVALAQDQYQHGVGEFLNVLDAQRSLLEAENALIESDRTIAMDLIALYKALGGGWEAEQG